MNDTLKLATTFLDAVALIMALVLMVSILRRKGQNKHKKSLLMGGLFSVAILFTMSDPIDLGAGNIFDMRGLLIGTATALVGPFVGILAMLTGMVYRISIGGAGVVPGLVGMAFAYGGGIFWLFAIKRRQFATWKKSTVLGCLITLQLLAILATPVAIWGDLFIKLAPYTLATNVLGALLINHLISGELSFLSEAETSRADANTDHLTGLLNRRGLELLYPDVSVANGGGRGRALLYFDIDNFKRCNDTHGHALGDDVLRQVSDRIAAHLRQNDIFARLGGDEFAVILNQIDVKEAKHIAERCRKVVANDAFQSTGVTLDLSISIGAVWMLGHTEIDAILDEADKALYVAKAKGRNKVVFRHAENAHVPSEAALVDAS